MKKSKKLHLESLTRSFFYTSVITMFLAVWYEETMWISCAFLLAMFSCLLMLAFDDSREKNNKRCKEKIKASREAYAEEMEA